MESGASSLTCTGRAFILVVASFLFLACDATAQQPATVQAAQGTQSGEVTAQSPQLAGQATVTVSQTPSSPASPQADAANPPKDTANSSGTVKLGPGDLIELNVYNVPELTTKARVSNTGDVYLPLVDYVHVAGLTQEEAQAVIEKRLEEGGFVRNPHVTIFVDEANSQGVTVLGEVAKPGIYADPADRKLYEVISLAGGFTGNAARKIAVIRRGQADAIHIDLPRNLGDDVSGNIDVLPGDTITVPKAPIIYVVGDVGRPSGLMVDNGQLTVLQALALAGGTNRTAKMGGARIIRKGPTGMTETRLKLKQMLEAKTPDVTLQADDILFVPVSAGRVAAARTIEAATAMATAVTVYSIRP
jgi:polysaccharide export outer membrane protein